MKLIIIFLILSASISIALETWDDSPRKTNQTVTFYINDSSYSSCTIGYDSEIHIMHSAETLFYFQDSFVSAGTLDYNITCVNVSGTYSQLGSATIEGSYIYYYVDDSRPDDSGNGLSWSTAKKTIGAAVVLMSGGDTLIIEDGNYTGASNMMDQNIPSGNVDKWTIVKARNAGQVLIDAEFADYRRPLVLDGSISYVEIHGLEFTRSGCGD